ncbi:ADP-ribose pyrophosphatase YjhB (NUDIX family) [Methylobacterium sp. PvP062]|uniref:ADP-ribose pyrophosphatase YjhB (NUDIX family) n=1 Tax=Methylobacterium radiotolerans TaxID=31998 RepID=A0ABV2NT77_9HYPH|nr:MULTISPECIES: NUDIX hydrolase N-terminal domain-containing protein [unclassified Methylobacterium]MBP2498970.1 ADP-ribose pyrophosphatase YjhB (NUDIX family) [Methylobacterium sp. PvP105]MBP2505531.1 ADP-ribose pyrophosphatase YjhB (NUDIX family) [Methylobacterium sp. PvP109]
MNDSIEFRWIREILAIAQSGLAHSQDPFDVERFRRLATIAAEMLWSDHKFERADLVSALLRDSGYATPKVEVRGAAFDNHGRILLVREKMDRDRWTLPGGWADVNLSLRENIEKEIFEEARVMVRSYKVAAVLDRRFHAHPPYPYHIYKVFMLCELVEQYAFNSFESTEISDLGYFNQLEIEDLDLSIQRVTRNQIDKMFEHYREPKRPTEYD